ncbi:hypothetical protein OV079_46115 [Nannocystis pusilla]|uniref:Uncharacterized protein n=1 Tax=Nannocystis pusilla TaxID=889268 RepID=A0A9X3J1J7_9BACT|nr:hypothetical protein [Nannocystis pusilla]MCY1012792.1 hypothetical protein [Nannocystis pusilla]
MSFTPCLRSSARRVAAPSRPRHAGGWPGGDGGVTLDGMEALVAMLLLPLLLVAPLGEALERRRDRLHDREVERAWGQTWMRVHGPRALPGSEVRGFHEAHHEAVGRAALPRRRRSRRRRVPVARVVRVAEKFRRPRALEARL